MAKKNASPIIILASSSPRRVALMTQAGLPPIVVHPNTDETEIKGESPRSMVSRLSREKADAVAARILAGLAPGVNRDAPSLIIAADTTVVAPDGKKILGKPLDEADARRMLARLAGREHTVLTSYCVLRLNHSHPSRALIRVVVSRVRMRELSRVDIARYVLTGEPMDKAGAYAAQGVGMALIESIRGSYANVVGLPICQLVQDLEQRFDIRLFGGSTR